MIPTLIRPMSRPQGAIQLPPHDEPSPTKSGAPSPDVTADDASSIYSRHALKVFRGSGGKSNGGSPGDSAFSMAGDSSHNGSARANSDSGEGASDAAVADEEAATYRQFRNKTLLRAAIQFTVLLVVCTGLLVVTLYFVLPPIDAADKPAVKIPRSFEQLKALNAVLQRYKDEYFFRVMFCWIVIYMLYVALSRVGRAGVERPKRSGETQLLMSVVRLLSSYTACKHSQFLAPCT